MGHKIERIMLVNPPATIPSPAFEGRACSPPLGLAYLAAVLEIEREVRILDCVLEGYNLQRRAEKGLLQYGLPGEEISKRMKSFAPQVVGVTSMFSDQAENALQMCRVAKAIDPSTITVMGGAHPSAVPDKVLLQESAVDYLILGEGEASFPLLLQSIEGGTGLEIIDGLAYRGKDLIPVVNPKAHFIENLDGLPFPARHLLPIERYFSLGRPHGAALARGKFATMITSRGCPARCIFCAIHSVWGNKYRARSAENVLAEIEHLIERYGVEEIFFEDDNLTFNRWRMESICQGIIDRGWRIRWVAPNGVALWALDEPLLAKMKKSGCRQLCVAIESGDEYVLNRLIRKPLDLSRVRPLVEKIKEMGIEVYGLFVLGCPGETLDQMRRTVEFACELELDGVQLAIMTPYPGSELWEICQSRGCLREGLEYRDLLLQGHGNIATPNFSPRDVERIQRWGYWKFAYTKWRKRPLYARIASLLKTGSSCLREPRRLLALVGLKDFLFPLGKKRKL